MKLQSGKIKTIHAREILDARGVPTVEATVVFASGYIGIASVPSGTDESPYAVHALKDTTKKRYAGRGVYKAVENINHTISKKLSGKRFADTSSFDSALSAIDKTKQKKKIGANALLAVSVACARAFASSHYVSLFEYLHKIHTLPTPTEIPTPVMNVMNGGRHADTNLDIEELTIIPEKKVLFHERLRMCTEIFYELGNILKQHGLDTDTGGKGGYAPNIHATAEAIRMTVLAIQAAGYSPKREVGIGIDVGAQMLYDIRMKQYRFKLDAAFYSPSQLIALYEIWEDEYPLILLEDGLSDNDWKNWSLLTERLGSTIAIAADDLYASQVERIKKGSKSKSSNTVVIKPNDLATLTDAIVSAKEVKKARMKLCISQRTGETTDDWIADFAVAVQADYAKFGAPNRGERIAKYNRLMAIEDELISK